MKVSKSTLGNIFKQNLLTVATLGGVIVGGSREVGMALSNVLCLLENSWTSQSQFNKNVGDKKCIPETHFFYYYFLRIHSLTRNLQSTRFQVPANKTDNIQTDIATYRLNRHLGSENAMKM